MSSLYRVGGEGAALCTGALSLSPCWPRLLLISLSLPDRGGGRGLSTGTPSPSLVRSGSAHVSPGWYGKGTLYLLRAFYGPNADPQRYRGVEMSGRRRHYPSTHLPPSLSLSLSGLGGVRLPLACPEMKYGVCPTQPLTG